MKFRCIPSNIRRHISIVYSQRSGELDRCLLSMVFVRTEIVLLPGSIYEIISHSACRTRLINFKWRYLPTLLSWKSLRIICLRLYLKSSTSNVYFVGCMYAIFRHSWPSCTGCSVVMNYYFKNVILICIHKGCVFLSALWKCLNGIHVCVF
jgi:hypothetical protein